MKRALRADDRGRTLESMPYEMVAGQRLFFARHKGPSEKAPALLLLHGAGGSRLEWPAELRRMPNAAVYVLDLPGHGRSELPGRDTIEDYASVVLAFIEKAGLRDVVVLGWSMGGAIAQLIGLRQPPAVTALVLVSTGARLRVMDAILEGVVDDFQATAEVIVDNVWAEGAPSALVEASRRRLQQADPAVVHGDYVACNRFDLMDGLSEIALPTLVINGTADRMTPLKYGRFLAQEIPDARLVVVEGAGHMVALEEPEAVAAAVHRFLGDLPEGA